MTSEVAELTVVMMWVVGLTVVTMMTVVNVVVEVV